MISVSRFLLTAVVAAGLSFPAAAAAPHKKDEAPTKPAASEAKESPKDTRDASEMLAFDEVWETVRSEFFDGNMSGVDWNGVRERYRPEYAAAKAKNRPEIIKHMLKEINASNLEYYTRADTEYYQLLDIFGKTFTDVNHKQAARAGANDWSHRFQGDVYSYEGAGLLVQESSGKLFVAGVLDGLPAAKAGLRRGDELLPVNGAPFNEISFFDGKLGQSVYVGLRHSADGPAEAIAVVPEWISPNAAFATAMEQSARIIPANNHKIGYVHVWSYAGAPYQRLLEKLISTGPLKDADALVIDLRDGWGGAQPGYLDIFSPNGPTMELTTRGGDHEFRNPKWRKPVALVVNEGTRSGKEVFAYGFKRYGLGPVIGSVTAKEVLAARTYILSDGSLLEIPVADVKVDGERLEGTGVTPTVVVERSLEYSHGVDPQLDRAVQEMSKAVVQ